jgi:hypothetical protein
MNTIDCIKNVHLPFGVDILPSPVIITCAAVVAEPADSDKGGNIKTAVSMSFLIESSGGDVGSSALLASEMGGPGIEELVEKDIGLSIIAMHLAAEECASDPVAP